MAGRRTVKRTVVDQEAPALIWVQSNRDDSRIVIHERDEAHPNGEILVGGALPVYVAETIAVIAKLDAKELVEVDADDAKAMLADYNQDRVRREAAVLRDQFPWLAAAMEDQGINLSATATRAREMQKAAI